MTSFRRAVNQLTEVYDAEARPFYYFHKQLRKTAEGWEAEHNGHKVLIKVIPGDRYKLYEVFVDGRSYGDVNSVQSAFYKAFRLTQR